MAGTSLLIGFLEENDIKSVTGILNGTTNFMLTKMGEEAFCYKKALIEAQKLGLADANPDFDVMGYNAARKLAALSTLAYKKRVYWKDISTKGITDLERQDFIYARLLGYQIKLIAESKKIGEEVYASVHPVLIGEDSLFSRINNEIKGVVFHGDEVGDVTFTGKGSGMIPSDSSICPGNSYTMEENKEVIPEKLEEASICRNDNDNACLLVTIKTDKKRNVTGAIRKKFKKAVLIGERRDELAFYLEVVSESEISCLLKELTKKGEINSYKNIPKLS